LENPDSRRESSQSLKNALKNRREQLLWSAYINSLRNGAVIQTPCAGAAARCGCSRWPARRRRWRSASTRSPRRVTTAPSFCPAKTVLRLIFRRFQQMRPPFDLPVMAHDQLICRR
jgi:hypothetical protein